VERLVLCLSSLQESTRCRVALAKLRTLNSRRGVSPRSDEAGRLVYYSPIEPGQRRFEPCLFFNPSSFLENGAVEAFSEGRRRPLLNRLRRLVRRSFPFGRRPCCQHGVSCWIRAWLQPSVPSTHRSHASARHAQSCGLRIPFPIIPSSLDERQP
jgi:hypothetical protein